MGGVISGTSHAPGARDVQSCAVPVRAELFDDGFLTQARLMSTVYTAIAAFEMSLRRFINKG